MADRKKKSSAKKSTSSAKKTATSRPARQAVAAVPVEPSMSVARAQSDVKAAVAAEQVFGQSASAQVATNTGIAGASSILVIYLATLAHVSVPVEVASAFTTLLAAVAGWLTHRKNYAS